jgi:glycosyltransferase involved in cell wall biosynthesis
MKIEVYAVCYNEERLLPYFIRHYSQFADICVYDNYSTDKSIEIMDKAGIKHVEFNTDGEFREDIMVDVRNNCWKESKADWVIICDIDELIYHKNISSALATIQGTVIMPRMFNMYADVFPSTLGQIYDEVNMGVDMNGKMNIFRPDQIKEMNYDAGCHNAHPEGNFELNIQSEILSLHFKYLSPEYLIWRNYILNARQSEVNRKNGWNWHFAEKAGSVLSNFRDIKPRLIKVI